MRARAALFDVYGGHLRDRGGAATIAALVRLLAPLGFSSAATRTAVSRMATQGWLQRIRLPGGPGYQLTERGRSRLDEAGARIYRTDSSGWDGQWHVVVLQRAAPRWLAANLRLLGYAPIGPATWIAPRASAELTDVLRTRKVDATTMFGRQDGDDAELAARAWDLAGLGARYAEFVAHWERDLLAVEPTDPPAAFAASQRLLHAWRKFLFADPGLPDALLPAGWQGEQGAKFFDAHTERLAPAAGRFVDSCLTPANPAKE